MNTSIQMMNWICIYKPLLESTSEGSKATAAISTAKTTVYSAMSSANVHEYVSSGLLFGGVIVALLVCMGLLIYNLTKEG